MNTRRRKLRKDLGISVYLNYSTDSFCYHCNIYSSACALALFYDEERHQKKVDKEFNIFL